MTGHRRENFGGGLEQICGALKAAADALPELDFVYPVHLNPNVKAPVNRLLGDIRAFSLCRRWTIRCWWRC